MKIKKTKTSKKMKKGTAYMCQECGLVVTVDQSCGCLDVCDLMCCGQQMAKKQPQSRKKK